MTLSIQRSLWKVTFVTLAIGTLFFAREKWRLRREYLHEETVLRHVKPVPFLKKEPAPWMLAQIEEDFRGIGAISPADIDAAFAKIAHLVPRVVRYRIVDGELYRYFVEQEPISLADNGTEKAIKTILEKSKLPNMDFIISYFDAYPFADVELNVPIFVSAKLDGTLNAPLIPDWRSIGHWWMSDIKAILKARTPWEKKRPFALWRGGPTKLLRYTLCQLSLDHPMCLDARFSSHPEEPSLRKTIEARGFLGPRCSWEEFLGCKYLPYVDGVMCAAPALQWRLLSGSLTFKPDSKEIQWFYRPLRPYIHYVPVNGDLSNLIEKIEWAKSDDDACKIIAENALKFAEENLMYADVLNYFSFVLKKYGSCQKSFAKSMKKEIEHNPQWVNIQSRQTLRKKTLGLFVPHSTPADL